MATGEKENTRDINQVRALKHEPMKAYVEPISVTDGRPKYIYECLANTSHNGDCMVTVYVYKDDSDAVQFSIERSGKWDSQWDIDAEAKAQANIAPYSIEGFYKG